jgi:hypothetical protein
VAGGGSEVNQVKKGTPNPGVPRNGIGSSPFEPFEKMGSRWWFLCGKFCVSYKPADVIDIVSLTVQAFFVSFSL